MESFITRGVAGLKRVTVGLMLAATVWLSAADVALGAAKKKEEAPAAPTKSYTVPYMLVLAVLGLGMMAVCRPSSRLEKLEDKLKTKSDDDE